MSATSSSEADPASAALQELLDEEVGGEAEAVDSLGALAATAAQQHLAEAAAADYAISGSTPGLDGLGRARPRVLDSAVYGRPVGSSLAAAALGRGASDEDTTPGPAAAISVTSPTYMLAPTPGGPATLSPRAIGAGHLFDPSAALLSPDPAAGLDGHMSGAAGLAALREADPGALGPLGPLAGAGSVPDAVQPVHPVVPAIQVLRAQSTAAAHERFTVLKNQPKPCCQRGCLMNLTEANALPFLTDVQRLDKLSREMFILVVLQQCRQSTHRRGDTEAAARSRDHYIYSIGRIGNVCHEAFIKLFGVKKGYIDTLQAYIRSHNTVLPREHKMMRQYRNDGTWILAGSPMREPSVPHKRARRAAAGSGAPLPTSARMLQLQPTTDPIQVGPALHVQLPPLLQPGDDDLGGDDLDDLDPDVLDDASMA